MQRGLIVLLFLALTGCVKNQVVDSTPQLPGGTFANFSVHVKQDLLNNVSAWVNSKGCSSYETQDTKFIKSDGDLLVDDYKRLRQGVLYETWVISYCGTTSTLGLVVTPDGAGGTWVSIAEQ